MPSGDVLNQAEINKPANNNVEKINKLRGKIVNYHGERDTTAFLANEIENCVIGMDKVMPNIKKVKNCHFLKNYSYKSLFSDAFSLKDYSVYDMNEFTESSALHLLPRGHYPANEPVNYTFKNLKKGFEKTEIHEILLSEDSLLNMLYELIASDEILNLQLKPINYDYLSTHYCSIIDKTDPKKKFKMCKETDRGAMTLLDYALKKNWKIIK